MPRKKKRKRSKKRREPLLSQLDQDTRKSIWMVVFFVLALFFLLAYFGVVGMVGEWVYSGFSYLLGLGYFLIPILFIILSITLFQKEKQHIPILRVIFGTLFFIASLGFIAVLSPEKGGLVGGILAKPLIKLFDKTGSIVVLLGTIIVSLIIISETRFHWLARLFKKDDLDEYYDEEEFDEEADEEYEEEDSDEEVSEEPEKEKSYTLSGLIGKKKNDDEEFESTLVKTVSGSDTEYTPPPLSILQKDKGKPGVGDIKANANIIKRTLENFGINVEMDEISIGPTVTRYALKPAEGVRLSKIVGLQNNLELALAAHPVRIEAPIPGKSLVGIEVPNSAKTTVGLASLLGSKEYQDSSKPLLMGLGKGISGMASFADLAKMPHVLIAGATGAGKSVTIHALVNSLLFRNGPDQCKFIMVDPKRVELTLYNGIPHLLTPVITQPKKAILALKWAGKEMDRRYDILEQHRVRDISSYHKNILPKLQKKASDDEPVEKMPYIVIIIDELADLMQAYPRELEAGIVRLAQMSRAVGIHLMISTQRPSVNVITGLIKANVPARIALQVSSQVDSRTILDTVGADKLLGQGDMLYLSGKVPKPVRIQSAFISEDEVKSVVKYLQKNYEDELPSEISIEEGSQRNSIFDATLDDEGPEEEDDLYPEAKEIVLSAGKASTSYLQRKLRVGYARAARLMDMLEDQGIIGPANGSKPREVLYDGGSDEESEETEEYDEEPDY